MSSLFSKSAIRQAISSFQGHDLSREIAIVQELYDDFRKGNMKDETRYEQNFNELFFHQLLGYLPKTNMHPKASTPVGSKIADVGLGFFEDGLYSYEGVKVVVELKGCDTLLDKKQASYGGQSPVDQGFGYKTSFKDCPWLIVSNFASVRLYRDNKQDFEVWTIEELANPDNDYYNLKTLLGLLKRNHLISQSGSSFSEQLLSEVRIKQEQITKDFYKQYKTLRFELINDIRHHNPEIHVETVVEKAQKIIDRIIFIHFCEDKGLLPEGKLKTNVIRAREADFSPWDVLKRYFKGVDSGSDKLEIPHGYNGGLFHTDPVLNDLEIGDAICHKFIDLGNYSFDDELSVNILGHIFEQSISDIEQLKGELIESTVIVKNEAIHSQGTTQDVDRHGHTSLAMTTTEKQLVEKKESKRKKDGIFYTPEYIVDYIVQNSLMVYLEEKEQACLNKVGKKSGHKTELEAYQEYKSILQNIKVLDPACGSGAFLVKVFDYLYAENKRVGQIVQSLFDDDEIYKSILRNNIYGVDLNPESVEITKLSLWLKSAQKGKKLNNLDENIKCGNSLIDDPAVAGDRAFDWQKEFSDIMGAGGFDVIVGNPPYVKVKDTNFSSYQTKKCSDLYAYFFEKGINILKNNGIISYITPSSYFTNIGFKSLRKFLLNFDIHYIIDLGENVFSDASVDSGIIVLSKKTNSNSQINVSNGNFDYSVIEKKIFLSFDDLNFDIYMKQSLLDIAQNIDKETIIADSILNFSRGVEFGFNSEYITNYNKQGNYPIICGGNLGRYNIYFEGKYIEYNSEKINLYKKLDIYLKEKILLRRIGNSITATYDNTGYFNVCDVYNLQLKEDNNFSLKYILIVLNSKLISFYFDVRFKSVKRLFPKIPIQNLKKLPIKDISLSDQQPFIDKADLMLSLNKELHDKTHSFLRYISSKFGLEKLSTKLSKFYDYDFATFLKELNPRSSAGQRSSKLSMSEEAELMEFFETKKSEIVNLKNQIDTTDREIDEMVYTLYGLNDEEKKIIEGS